MCAPVSHRPSVTIAETLSSNMVRFYLLRRNNNSCETAIRRVNSVPACVNVAFVSLNHMHTILQVKMWQKHHRKLQARAHVKPLACARTRCWMLWPRWNSLKTFSKALMSCSSRLVPRSCRRFALHPAWARASRTKSVNSARCVNAISPQRAWNKPHLRLLKMLAPVSVCWICRRN